MFWKKKRNGEALPNALYFKDAHGLFEYECKFGDTEIRPEHGIVALVVDARHQFGADQPTRISPDGSQTLALHVAAKDGGFHVVSRTVSPVGEILKPGDPVVWVPVEYTVPEGVDVSELDPRFSWVGFVIAKIAPQINFVGSPHKVLSSYLEA